MPNQSAELDGVFRALADPVRRAVLERLCHGAASVSELAGPIRMSMPALLQHLGVLESGGLIRTEKTGRVRTCTLTPDGFRLAERWIEQRRSEWNDRLDRLGQYLARLDPQNKTTGGNDD